MGIVFDEVEAKIEGGRALESAPRSGESEESGARRSDQLKRLLADQQRRAERTRTD